MNDPVELFRRENNTAANSFYAVNAKRGKKCQSSSDSKVAASDRFRNLDRVRKVSDLRHLVARALRLFHDRREFAIPRQCFDALVVFSVPAVDQLTGNIPVELGNLTRLTHTYFYGNQFTGLGGEILSRWTASVRFRFQNNALDQAAVDAVISQIHGARLAYANAAPELRLDGTNAAPSGNYTNPVATPGATMTNANWIWNVANGCHDAQTGKAMIYDLENALISSISIGGGNGDKPVETVTLNYSKITWTYSAQKEEGGKEGEVKGVWDVALNKSG